MRDALRNSDGRALATPFNLRKHCPTHTRQLRELLERQIALFPKGSNSITECATHRVLSCSLLRRWPSHSGTPFCSHCPSHTLPRSLPNSIDSVLRELPLAGLYLGLDASQGTTPRSRRKRFV